MGYDMLGWRDFLTVEEIAKKLYTAKDIDGQAEVVPYIRIFENTQTRIYLFLSKNNLFAILDDRTSEVAFIDDKKEVVYPFSHLALYR